MRKAKITKQDQMPVFNIEDRDNEFSKNSDSLQDQLSFFDIKELYDEAYAAVDTAKKEGRNDYKAREMMAEAVKMDMAYRCQLARYSHYKKHAHITDFKILTESNQ